MSKEKNPNKKKMSKKKKIILIVVVIAAVLIIVQLAGTGIWYMNYMGYFADGNKSEYSLDNAGTVEDSPLEGLTIGQLGSSVTYGLRSKGVSFADYIAERNNCTSVKEAVSGTKLVTGTDDNYVDRLMSMDTDTAFDLMMIQLSTNDAGDDPSPIGEISDSAELEDFDTTTVIGAIEAMIVYTQETWNCPVVFYTCPQNDKAGYEDMVNALYEVQEKWGIEIIDLYSELDINMDEYDLYMADSIHPTQAGYLLWWTPVMEEHLYAMFE